MTSKELVQYLTKPDVRPLLNWSALTQAASLKPHRIKNVCLGNGGDFKEKEVMAIVRVLERLIIQPLTTTTTYG